MKPKKIISIIIIIFAIGCGLNSGKEKNTDKNNSVKQEFTGKPEIKFEYDSYDFGELYEGEKVECYFIFENTGKGVLKIKNIEADCGCTVPELEKKEVMPGQKSEIKITFDTYGFRNNVYKTIKIKTNADTSETKLVLTAFIKSNNNLN